ncbi:hypothetical protein J2S43_000997 [Catenuloplanes nepalensis]|uniref:AMP-dependent synthetase/ligase domain-containing protein n=1 Tax=Catenuloplanes nepalensis TaxID=587533 RepID=A0ABT9MM24_9ACTN|nr:AMP-binding protein [Catenuloplanes nepalensis]MDP9792485.1 hypothetical protein [Catenuloplanes nepalensis]
MPHIDVPGPVCPSGGLADQQHPSGVGLETIVLKPLSDLEAAQVLATQARSGPRYLAAGTPLSHPVDLHRVHDAVRDLTLTQAVLRTGLAAAATGEPQWQIGAEAHICAEVLPAIPGRSPYAILRRVVLGSRITLGPAPLVRIVIVDAADGVLICTVAHPALLDRGHLLRLQAQLVRRIARPQDTAPQHDGADRPQDASPDAAADAAEVQPAQPAAAPTPAGSYGILDHTGAEPLAGWATTPDVLMADALAGADTGPGWHQRSVPSSLVHRLRKRADAAGRTLGDILLGAHVKALALATGRTAVTVIAGPLTWASSAAAEPGDDGVRGADTTAVAPVVFQLAGTTSWDDLMERCRPARWQMSETQDRNRIGPDRSSVADAAFSFVHGPAGTVVHTPSDASVQLEFCLTDGDRMSMRIAASDAARQGTLAELARLHLATLEHCLDGQAEHRALPALDAALRELVIRRWNGVQRDYPADRCVHHLFEQQAERTPHAAAAADDSGTMLTYRQLNLAANRLAYRLQDCGLRPGGLAAIAACRSAGLVVAVLAVLKTGAAYLPLDPRQPRDRLRYLLQDSRADLVVADERYRDRIPCGHVPIVPLDATGPLPAGADDNPRTQATPGDLMYLIYTSGSTGIPKGVQVPHSGVLNYLGWCAETYAGRSSGGAALFSSVAFDAVVPNIFVPLLRGQRVYVLDETLDMDQIAQRLARQSPFSFLKLTPGQLALLAALLSPAQRAVREVTSVSG